MGLWNELAAHQDPQTPFCSMPVSKQPSIDNLGQFATVRVGEVNGFIEGLLNGGHAAALPNRVRQAVTHLSEIGLMMRTVAELAERSSGDPQDPEQLKRTFEHLGVMTGIMELEIHAAVVACAAARTRSDAGRTATGPTRH